MARRTRGRGYKKMRRGKERCVEEKKGRVEEETKDIRDLGPGITERYFVLWGILVLGSRIDLGLLYHNSCFSFQET